MWQVRESRLLWCAVRVLPLLLLAAALTACGGGSSDSHPSSPPTISNLQFSPHSVAEQSGGTASIQGNFEFADAGGDLASVTLVASDSNGTMVGSGTGQIQGAAGQKAGTVHAAVTVRIDQPGLYTLKVTVSDQGGAVSNALQGTFRISVAANLAPSITPAQPGVRELKLANGYLYWSEIDQSVIKRVPAAGGHVDSLAPKVSMPSAPVFANSDVIWMDFPLSGSACEVSRTLNRTNAAGATQLLAHEAFCAMLTTTDVVADGANAYWVASTQAPDTYLIRAMPLAGGTITTIATSSNPVVALKVYGGRIFWLERTLLTTTRWIRSAPVGGGPVQTVVDGFYAATDTFAADSSAVYYAETIAIPGSPSTISLLAQPLAGGSPQSLATNIRQPAAFAADGAELVWTDSQGFGMPGATNVNVLSLAGGAPVVLASSARVPTGLVISGGNAVWSEDRLFNQGTTAIYSVPLSGGATTVLYQADVAASGLTLNSAGNTCWTENDPVGYPGSGGRIACLQAPNTSQTLVEGIYRDAPTFVVAGNNLLVADWQRLKRIPIGGGVIETLALAPGIISGVTSDGTTAYFAAGGSVYSVPIAGGPTTVVSAAQPGMTQSGPIRFAPNGNLYWVADNTNIAYAPASGGTPTLIATGSLNIGPLAVDASGVYFGFQTFPGITRIPLAGGPPSGVTITNQNGGAPVMDLLLDAGNIYWVDALQIAKVPVDGGDADALVAFTSPVAFGSDTSSLAIDSGHLYWTEPTPPNIRSTPR